MKPWQVKLENRNIVEVNDVAVDEQCAIKKMKLAYDVKPAVKAVGPLIKEKFLAANEVIPDFVKIKEETLAPCNGLEQLMRAAQQVETIALLTERSKNRSFADCAEKRSVEFAKIIELILQHKPTPIEFKTVKYVTPLTAANLERGNYMEPFLFEDEIIQPILIKPANGRQHATFAAYVPRPKTPSSNFEVDDDEADYKNFEMARSRCAVRTVMSLGSTAWIESKRIQEARLAAFSKKLELVLQLTRAKQIQSEIYHENKSHGKGKQRSNESDEAYEQREKSNEASRNSRQKSKRIETTNCEAHNVIAEYNDTLEQEIHTIRQKISKYLRILMSWDRRSDHPLIDVLQDENVHQYINKYYLPRGQLVINKWIKKRLSGYDMEE